jgi:hypothetical protein
MPLWLAEILVSLLIGSIWTLGAALWPPSSLSVKVARPLAMVCWLIFAVMAGWATGVWWTGPILVLCLTLLVV